MVWEICKYFEIATLFNKLFKVGIVIFNDIKIMQDVEQQLGADIAMRTTYVFVLVLNVDYTSHDHNLFSLNL